MKNLTTYILVLFALPSFAAFQDSSNHYFQKGLEEKQARRYQVASQHFTTATMLNPSFVPAYIENGYVNLEMRKMDAARKHFSKANELEPNNSAVIKELVNIHFNYRQYDKAIEFARKCASCEGSQRIIGMSYYQMEDYTNAEKVLLALVNKDAKDAEAMYTLGKTYMELEQEGKAITYLQKAVDLDPTKGTWACELGLLNFNARNYKAAVAAFNKAAENGYTQSNDFKENLGFALIYSREFDKGEAVLNEVIAKKGGTKDIMRDLAQAFYDYKAYDKSLEYCQRLLEMDAKDGKALYQAGLCFQKKGQKQRGQQMCDKAIEMDPSLAGLRRQEMLTMGL